jgi:hypothetical protein
VDAPSPSEHRHHAGHPERNAHTIASELIAAERCSELLKWFEQ